MMASYHPEELNLSRDNDIQVINRGEPSYQALGNEEYPRHDNLASPGFPSLDIPSPNGDHSQFFDEFDQKHDGQFSSSISPLTEVVNGHVDHIDKDATERNHERNNNTGALTRLSSSYVPPLAPLSDSVLPSTSLSVGQVPGNYLTNNYPNPNRSQLMIAGKKKKDNPGSKGRPAFVMKIWSMVNDPANQEYIRWDNDGTTFQVYHREEFMKRILPKYFKHNNFASFVRQLNMYGWHKVQDITSGSMAKEAKNAEEVWQFKNPYFIKGREDLLDKIVRNKAGSQEEVSDPTININALVTELDQIKMNQLAIIEDMRRIRKDNQTLWTESFTTRDRYQKQSQTLDKIMQFLAAIYGNSAGKIFEVENGTYDSNFGPPALYHGGQSPRPVYSNTAPILKSRLMLMDQEHLKTPSDRSTPVADSKRPSESGSKDGSIEEIVRNDHLTPHSATANVNKIYQQIMNLEPEQNSPRQFLPDLNSPALPPHSPTPLFSRLSTSEGPNSDALHGLEQNIFKQGQALLQVQDWIQALANRQQQQQQQLQQQKSGVPLPGPGEIDDFDVNDFLNNFSNPAGNTLGIHENDGEGTADADYEGTNDNKKRHIEEITENEPQPKRGRTRSSSRRR